MPHPFQTQRFLAALFGTFLIATNAAGQTSDRPFDELSRYLDSDDTIYVVGRTTGELRGRGAVIAGNGLTITTASGPARIASDEIGWIEKRGDPVWNGALVGAGISSILFAAGAGASCSDCGHDMTIAALAGVGIGGGLGAAIDWLHPGRTLVYGQRPSSVHSRRADPPVDRIAQLWSRIRPGDDVSVRRRGAATMRGRFVRATDVALVIEVDGRQIQVEAAELEAVDRHGSYLGHGLVFGPAVGAALIASSALGSGASGDETLFAAAIGGITGLAWGGLIGRIVPRHISAFDVSPRTVRVQPILAPGQRGALLSIRY